MGAPGPQPQPLVSPWALWARGWQGLSGTWCSVPTHTHLCSPPQQKGDRIRACLPSDTPWAQFPSRASSTRTLGQFCRVRFQCWREQSIPLPTVLTGDSWSPRGCAGHRQLCHGLWDTNPQCPALCCPACPSHRCVTAAQVLPQPNHSFVPSNFLDPFPRFPVNSCKINWLCVS